MEAHGLDVQYTRTTDIYESPYQKAMEANNAGVDFFVLFIEIHFLQTMLYQE